MKITLTVNTDVESDISSAISFLRHLNSSTALNTLSGTDDTTTVEADTTTGEAPTKEAAYDPEKRVWGKPGQSTRRTKAEMTEDEELGAEWAELWPSKSIPSKPVGELRTIIAGVGKTETDEEKPKEDDGFEWNEDTDTPTSEDPPSVEDMRAALTEFTKKHGRAKLGAAMAPYKSLTEVPEDERREYMEKLLA